MTTQEGLPALATTDLLVAQYRVLCDLKGEMEVASVRMPTGDLRALLTRLEAAERQVKALRKDLTFVGAMAVYALKTDDDDTSGILATIRDTSRAALEAKSHDD